MSRIGKYPVQVPGGVTVEIKGQKVSAKGKLGQLETTLMDDVEWTSGYGRRFGLFHVDYETLRRTPRDSAFWYRDVIAANAVPGDPTEA